MQRYKNKKKKSTIAGDFTNNTNETVNLKMLLKYVHFFITSQSANKISYITESVTMFLVYNIYHKQVYVFVFELRYSDNRDLFKSLSSKNINSTELQKYFF